MPSSIEWTDRTWNPVTGCKKISPGCKNCYAEGIANRFFAKQYPPNPDGSPRQFTDVRCHENRLHQPLSWKKPCRVFVNSMSDLFHEDVPFEFIARVWAICSEAREHTFQILTKRPQRMLDFAKWMAGADDRSIAEWPRNCQLGVSVENQKYADERIPLLLQTPAAARLLSVEPMLEAIDIGWALSRNRLDIARFLLRGPGLEPIRPINWVICGGESGPGARPFNLGWAESLLQQCQSAGVPFFMKQCGSDPVYGELRWLQVTVNERLKRKPGGLGNCFSPVHIALKDRKGGEPSEWPKHLRVRQFPEAA